jgi:uncharacterized protein YjbI with pentapeptide repeats
MKEHAFALATVFIAVILTCEASSSAPSDSHPTSMIASDTILNQLRNDQPVTYDHVEIIGDLILDLSRDGMGGEETPKTVNSTIIISNSTFHGKINFDRAHFKKPVVMEGNLIEGEAHFRNASFLNQSSFGSTDFRATASFEGANFSQEALFKRCTFEEGAVFYGSVYTKEANFDWAKFTNAYFQKSQFGGCARFGRAIFQESANFEDSRFLDNAIFNQAEFFGKAFLGGVKFDGRRTYFTQANFHDSASFSGSIFSDVYFNDAKFVEEAAFLNCSFDGNVRFSNTQFQKDAIFYQAKFSSNLNLDGCSYYKLILHWNSIRNHLKPDEKIYDSLIKNYKNLFWISDVNECYFDLRNWKQSMKPWTDITKIFDVFLEWYCGYGTRPQNTLFWIGLVSLLFGLYYWSKGGVYQIQTLALGRDKILLTAKKVSEDTFQVEHIPKPKKELSRIRSLLSSLKFSLFVLAQKNTDDIETEKGIWPQIVELERWLGRGLFVIFGYYVGSLVVSYFTPLP